MTRDWDLVVHFDTKGKLFIKRDYEYNGDYFSRVYLKTLGREVELLELLNWWYKKNDSRHLGGMFKLNNHGEVLKRKKLVGEVKTFPDFIDFIIDRTYHSEICKSCGEDLELTIVDYEKESWVGGQCTNDDCNENSMRIDFFRAKFVDDGHLCGMPEFRYSHPVDRTKLYSCLIQEYNLYWRRVNG